MHSLMHVTHRVRRRTHHPHFRSATNSTIFRPARRPRPPSCTSGLYFTLSPAERSHFSGSRRLPAIKSSLAMLSAQSLLHHVLSFMLSAFDKRVIQQHPLACTIRAEPWINICITPSLALQIFTPNRVCQNSTAQLQQLLNVVCRAIHTVGFFHSRGSYISTDTLGGLHNI